MNPVKEYTLSFDANGHGTAPQGQVVSYEGYATNPGNLDPVGDYTFTGNETWVQNATDTTGIYKYHFAKTGLKALSGGSAIPNILCDGLETKSNNQMYSRINGVGQNTLGTEIVVFNSGVQSVNAMKTFMQGKTIYYELATPTTETINSLMLPKGITKVTDANGVELEIE